jgi:hypothetical protein
VDILGLTSNGSQAFIPTIESSRFKLQNKRYKSKYILDNTSSGVGYFHLETWNAEVILYAQVHCRIHTKKSDATYQNLYCLKIVCSIEELEDKIAKMTEIEDILKERIRDLPSSKPTDFKILCLNL